MVARGFVAKYVTESLTGLPTLSSFTAGWQEGERLWE